MTLNADQQKELAAFPLACLELINAELAAGNSIQEIGHSFPAPPSGAYVKLEKVVGTRARADGQGLEYRARNSSLSSGEYTDKDCRYFIVEPPEEEAAQYPDMDAIRRALAPKPQTASQLAEQKAAVAQPSRRNETPKTAQPGNSKSVRSVHAYSATELPAGLIQLLHFQDARPFHEVQFALERDLMTLFVQVSESEKLCLRAEGSLNGARYIYNLQLEAVLASTNCCSFRAEGLWAQHTAEHDEYFRKTSRSWFEYWTSDLTPANPPDKGAPAGARYASVSEAAVNAEANLNSVEAIQRAIVAGLKSGGRYSTAHKEGGTVIAWRGGAWVRDSYGEDPSNEKLADDAALLKALWHFCESDITRHAINGKVSDVDMWKLIWRRMNPD